MVLGGQGLRQEENVHFAKMVGGRADGQGVLVGMSERPKIPGRICCGQGHQDRKVVARLP